MFSQIKTISLCERIYKNLGRGEGPKVNDGACPIKNHGF